MDIIDFQSRQEPPTYAEIPAGRDVLFTALGGDGEPGRNGGDGQNGMDGVDGAPATRELDAIVCFVSVGEMSCRLVCFAVHS